MAERTTDRACGGEGQKREREQSEQRRGRAHAGVASGRREGRRRGVGGCARGVRDKAARGAAGGGGGRGCAEARRTPPADESKAESLDPASHCEQMIAMCSSFTKTKHEAGYA